MTQPDDQGFVKRGFMLLGGMTLLVALVLGIIFYKPAPPPPRVPSDLPTQPSAPGWQVRYNAAATLARRGSDQVPWHIVREMLDEKQQLRNHPVVLHDGTEVPDEALARSTVIMALKAVAEWHRRQAQGNVAPRVPAALTDVYAQVDLLAQSPLMELKLQAERTRQTFFR